MSSTSLSVVPPAGPRTFSLFPGLLLPSRPLLLTYRAGLLRPLCFPQHLLNKIPTWATGALATVVFATSTPSTPGGVDTPAKARPPQGHGPQPHLPLSAGSSLFSAPSHLPHSVDELDSRVKAMGPGSLDLPMPFLQTPVLLHPPPRPPSFLPDAS